MTEREQAILDAVEAAARRATTTPGSSGKDDRALARDAIRRAKERRDTEQTAAPPSSGADMTLPIGTRHALGVSRPWGVAVAGLTLAAAAAALLVYARPGEDTTTEDGAPRVTTLVDGDQIVTYESELQVLLDDDHQRLIELTDGEALFDVTPLHEGGWFVVRTPHREVRVRGTVFSVAVSQRGTAVHVYEGRVEVGTRGAPPERALTAGQSYGQWASEDVFEEEAVRRVRGRRAIATHGTEADALARTPVASNATEAAFPGEAAPATGALEADALEADALEVGAVETREGGRPVDDVPNERPPSRVAPGDRSHEDGARSDSRVAEPAGPDGTEDVRTEQHPPAGERTRPGEASRALERVPGTSQARAHLREGHPELALQLARENAQADDGGAWRWIEIDALRAMRRHRDAAERLAALAPTLPPAERPAAGFLLANLRLDRLHDPQGALTALHELGCDEDPALRQRSLALRVHALAEAGRPDEARDAALHYLERYPTGEHRAQMQRFADRR